jgi:zinc transport system substrate-binding protein
VNYPLHYFAERIGGERVHAVFPAPPGRDPAHWSPDAETVAAYQRADLLLLNGFGYARWLERASLRRGRLVDTSAGFAERAIPLEGSLTHTHGPGGAHSHRGVAVTTWLDPKLAILQAAAIRDALSAARPAREAEFSERFETLEADLRALDQSLAAAATAIGDAPLLFSHPVYQYLERRYDLNSRSLEWEPNEPPSRAMWRELEALLVEHPATWLLWEAEPLADTEHRLEVLGIRSIVYEPTGNAPEHGDFLGIMRNNASQLGGPGRQATSAQQ